MDYQNLVVDFARRTRENLRTLQALKREGREVYEVTALVNSLLGLLVFPHQKFFDEIPEIALIELSNHGWPIPRVIGDYPQAPNLRALIRKLRHSISHFDIEFTADKRGKVSGLKLWNQAPRTHKTVWVAEISIADLERLVLNFVALLLDESDLSPSYEIRKPT